MDNEAHVIKENIVLARENIVDNIEDLESRFKGAVGQVKETAQKFNPVYQAKEHPLAAAAISIAAGALIGVLLGGKKTAVIAAARSARPLTQPVLRRLQQSTVARAFQPEINMARNMIIGAVFNTVARKLSERFPNLEESLGKIRESALSRMESQRPLQDDKGEFSPYA